MPRPPRILFQNACYHIMNRGAGRKAVFKSDEQRELFLRLLAEASDEFGLQVLAYCLMGNHFHLLVRTPNIGLSEAMRQLIGVYTKKFNKLEKTDGALFRGRFKAILVDADDYLVEVSRYIHLNPVDAKLVRNANEYAWSSYRAYVDPGLRPHWLHTDEILFRVGSRENRISAYKSFIETPRAASLRDFYNSSKLPGVLGSKAFREHVSSLGFRIDRKENRPIKISVNEVIEAVASYFKTSTDIILAPKAGRRNDARIAAILLSRKYCQRSWNELAEIFSLSRSGLASSILRFTKKSETQKAQHDALREIENLIAKRH